MLFETLLQPLVFFALAGLGFASGVFFDLGSYVVFLCKNNRLVRIGCDFVATMCAFCVFYFAILHLCYGQVRAYQIFTFILFLVIEQLTVGKLFAIFIDKCYNFFVRIFESLSKGLQKWKKHNKS
jgi:hypothetical protein